MQDKMFSVTYFQIEFKFQSISCSCCKPKSPCNYVSCL